MSKEIFKNWSYIYYDNGLPIIPLEHKGKRPCAKDWTIYCNVFPEIQDIESWCLSFPDGNIGMPMGKASRMIALDIDTDDEEVLQLLPKSNCIKVGQKGETRFFKYSEDTIIREFNIGKKCFAEILSTGRQTVLPPSIHPNIIPGTKNNFRYRWTTDLTLCSPGFDSNSLPELGNEWHEPLVNLLEKKYKAQTTQTTNEEKESNQEETGRNNKLKSMVSAMIIKWKTPDEITREIYDYDKDNHNPRLFTDASENFTAKNEDEAYNNARKFYFSIFSSFMRDPNKAKLIEEQFADIKIEAPKETQVIDDFEAGEIPEYPKLGNSYIDLFVEYCDNVSNHNIKPISLGAGLSLMSILAANKVRGQFSQFDVRPNLYSFALAPSGTGKSIPQETIKKLFLGKEYIKTAAFKSAASMIETLPIHQEQLLMIDEASSLLRSISSSLSFQADISNAIREIYSCSGSFYGGISSKASGQAFGACYNPSLTILASSTCNEFDALINEQVSEGGFLPRFLFFRQNARGAFKDVNYNSTACEGALIELQNFVNEMNSIKPKIIGSTDISSKSKYGNRYDPMVLPLNKAASEAYYDVLKRTLTETDESDSPYKSRKVEHVCKMALLAAFSRRSHMITEKEILWAEKVWDIQHEFSIKKIQLSYAPNDFYKYMIMVKEMIAKNSIRGKLEMTKVAFNVNLSKMKGRTPMTTVMKKMIIAELVETGFILDRGKTIEIIRK